MSLAIASEPVPFAEDSDGVVRIGKTRITLGTVVSAFLEGATAEEIAQQYSTLDLADVYSVLACYLRQRSEIDAYLRRCHEQAEAVQKQNESQFDPHGIRDRLIGRRSEPQR